MGNAMMCFGVVGCIDQASIGVVEKWGRFDRLASPGFNLFNPFAGECLAGLLFHPYLLSRCPHRDQDQVVRAHVPKMTLDEVFEQKNDVAKAVSEELEKLVTCRLSLLAAQRMQLASVYKGEAEKVLLVKKAEAEAEAKYLGGVGVARQRQAITEGLRENIVNFSHRVEGTSAKEVMDLIMITQYFDTIKDLGNSSKNTTVFIPHGPGHVRDIGDQIRNGLMEAASAKTD
ncbi:hypothetical protein Sjap_020837 [Stephania japonica]|uniref:Uncharacterized protein n=1 Tax=Stephania japonica TaxID=461633 RepID=A0AAP0F8S7_9MAGN